MTISRLIPRRCKLSLSQQALSACGSLCIWSWRILPPKLACLPILPSFIYCYAAIFIRDGFTPNFLVFWILQFPHLLPYVPEWDRVTIQWLRALVLTQKSQLFVTLVFHPPSPSWHSRHESCMCYKVIHVCKTLKCMK